MAEYTEYRRKQRRTVQERSHKSSYIKKFACQLTVSVVIFALVYSPILPHEAKEAFKKALTYNVDTTYFSNIINQAFKNTPFDNHNKKEDVINENTEPTAKNL